MPEYIFISGSDRVEAANYDVALALCYAGKVRLDSEVMMRSAIGAQRYPLSFDKKLLLAASNAHGIFQSEVPPFSLIFVMSTFISVVCAAAVMTSLVYALTDEKHAWYLKSAAGACLASMYFSSVAIREYRFRSRYSDLEYIKEAFAVQSSCRPGNDSNEALQRLHGLLKPRANSYGVALRGAVRVFDFSGKACDARVTSRDGLVHRIKVTPKR